MHFIKDLLERSNSKAAFATKLKSVGLGLDYGKDGTVRGVLDSNGKPYSWKKLGISKEALIKLNHREQLMHLDKRISRLEFYQKTRNKSKSKNKEIDR